MLKTIVVLVYLAFLFYKCHYFTKLVSFNHLLNPIGNVSRSSTLSLELNFWPSQSTPDPFAASRKNKFLRNQIQPFLSRATANEKQYRFIPSSQLHPIRISASTSYWNPTIVGLPSFSPHRYLVVSRILTDGSHHLNIACLADWIYHDNGASSGASISALVCDPSTLQTLNVPPTVSKSCSNSRIQYEMFPGFHDARISWTRNGDILVVAGGGSIQTCFSMHAFSLLPYYSPVDALISGHTPFGLGPHLTFPYITEIERPKPYAFFEKNWVPIHSSSGLHFQSDHSPGIRTVAKHYGFGKVGSNLTDYDEKSCFPGEGGKWHMGTGLLEVVLCKRNDTSCRGSTVFAGLVHRKITNSLGLMHGSGKYEKFVVIYDSASPFRTLAFGNRAVLWGGEREDGFVDVKDDEIVELEGGGDGTRRTFTYTLSLAWDNHDKVERAEDMGRGYLDDDVVAGVGVGDNGVFVARFRMGELLEDLRMCE